VILLRQSMRGYLIEMFMSACRGTSNVFTPLFALRLHEPRPSLSATDKTMVRLPAAAFDSLQCFQISTERFDVDEEVCLTVTPPSFYITPQQYGIASRHGRRRLHGRCACYAAPRTPVRWLSSEAGYRHHFLLSVTAQLLLSVIRVL